MKYQYGHFEKDGAEFVITDPATPRAFDNFLWNDGAFSCIQQTGVGYFDYQYDGKEAVKLLTGIGRICDFDVHGRDGLMSRLVYIRDNETGEFWTLNWEPVRAEYEVYRCTHGMGYTILESKVAGIRASMRIFIPVGSDPVELWTLQISNESGQPRDLSVFVYNQFALKYKWGFDSYGDMIYRNSYYSEDLNAVVATKHPHIRPHDYLTGFLCADAKACGYDGSRDDFVGVYNTLADPQAVIDGQCTNGSGSADATIGVLQFGVKMGVDGTQAIEMILGGTDSEEGIDNFRGKYLGKMDAHFQELQEASRETLMTNHLVTPDEHFNRMFNCWIKHQTHYGATWCRWGWMGYRDIVQHGYGVSAFEPKRTRNILMQAVQYQYKGGLALRGWNPIDKKAYSDSALWLVFTLCAYLKDTGDLALLDEVLPFFDGEEATVLQHVERAMDFLENNKGSHGICLIKFGDWNDSLTAVGAQGRGESIWLTMAYAEAMKLLSELMAHLGDENKSAEYQGRYQSVKDALNANAWDGEWFVRCFDDSGRAIGSKEREQGKIFLNAQSWAMIAGIADEERAETLVNACNRELSTEIGYRLLAPTFVKPDEFLGRISHLEPGICENSTVYAHGNVFMMLGLLRAGQPDKAYELFKQITPGYMERADSPKQKCPPYIFANGYYGPDHRRQPFQMEFTWITGSVAWFYNVILREMVGVQAGYAGLTIAPKLPADWPEVSLDYQVRGKSFKIKISNTSGMGGKVELNGTPIDGAFIPWEKCLDNNTINVG